ncbi:hypothetical protein [Mycobacterium sp. 236(2023)]|uniref:hypothetical protein n=1 Tax=Mycobacterium sp. 236(2023) TaxID=3038163 RepID=UPI00241583D5|nr:hypothetical protein [Mycobacterium sp. 236(2023)]MDG4667889.1 hypothetical protein [Mycobacterium sp. 236(2023)]
MADKWGISINVETGELSYMPVEPRLQRKMEERVDIIEAEIQNLLLRAGAADDGPGRRDPRRDRPGDRRTAGRPARGPDGRRGRQR